jgi:hypothetical protein
MDRPKFSSHGSPLSGVRRMDQVPDTNRNKNSPKKNAPTVWDYKTLDQEIQFAHRKTRKERAKSLGYHHITEALVKLYRKHKSSYKVAEILGLTSPAVLYTLKLIGEPKVGRGCYPRKKDGKSENQ